MSISSFPELPSASVSHSSLLIDQWMLTFPCQAPIAPKHPPLARHGVAAMVGRERGAAGGQSQMDGVHRPTHLIFSCARPKEGLHGIGQHELACSLAESPRGASTFG